MAILDTNVLIGYLTQDNADQAARAAVLLEQLASGTITATLPEAVLSETVFVLSSKNTYAMTRDAIRLQLSSILSLPGMEIPGKQRYLRTLDLYTEFPALSFVDALCAAHAEEEPDRVVLSFDKDFRRVESIVWQEP